MTVGSAHGVALALPGFGAALDLDGGGGDVEPRLPDTQWLASRGHRQPDWPGDWRAWLLSRFGPGADTLRRCPPGASVRALVTGRRDQACWACAEPVHLLVGLDHLLLAPRAALELSVEDGRALAASLDAALAGSGYSLSYSEHGRWMLACPADIDCETVEPAQAEGRDVRESLPAGRDGAQVRRLMNELQMLLHEHPVNARRAERGLPPVNSIWLWGFGRAVDSAVQPLPALCSDDDWLSGLWRLHGAEARPLADASSALAAEATLLIAAADAGGDPAVRLGRWESQLCAPLAAALRQGRVRNTSLLLGCVPYALSATARFAVWRGRRSWTELIA